MSVPRMTVAGVSKVVLTRLVAMYASVRMASTWTQTDAAALVSVILKTMNCHVTNYVVIGGTVGCRNDNLRLS